MSALAPVARKPAPSRHVPAVARAAVTPAQGTELGGAVEGATTEAVAAGLPRYLQATPAQARQYPGGDLDSREGGAEHAARLIDRAANVVPPALVGGRPLGPRAGRGLADPASPGRPLDAAVRPRLESATGLDLAPVRVHSDARAARVAASGQAQAVTRGTDIWLGASQRGDNLGLMAHEVAHVAQQSHTGMAVQARPQHPSPASVPAEARADEGRSGIGFSEDEMVSRLQDTPPDGASLNAPTVAVDASTASTLDAVEAESGRDASADGAAPAPPGAPGRPARGAAARPVAGSTAPVPPGVDAGVAAAPSPMAAFENLVSADVAAYLDGNLSSERMAALDPQTQALLEAADALGGRSITDPDARALEGLGGDGLSAAAPTTGYENEPAWLQTVATIRDVAGQLGGIVGIIGLVATVSGFILSLLMPPVGAFLLTVGRFCDIAALVLDGISLVLGALLTGYNYYRLKNETDPEERRRLLGMVRADAMGTVMSGVAVATAVAPGAARVLGRSRVGRVAGRAVRSAGSRVAGAATRLAAQPGRLGRAAAAVGRAGGAGMRAARSAGGAVSGRFHTLMGRTRDLGLGAALRATGPGRLATRVAGTAPGRAASAALGYAGRGVRTVGRSAPARWIGRGATRIAGGLGTGARRLAGSSVGRRLADSRLGRYANRVYGENLDLARLMFANSERSHHVFVGSRLRAELAAAQGGGALSELAARNSLAARGFPEVDVNRLAFSADPSGRLILDRPGSRLNTFLTNMRRDEARAIRNLIAGDATLTDAALAARMNARPNAPARWTEAEIASFRAQTGNSARRVLKTPHHTIPVNAAPHLAYDPRYIHLANAPLNGPEVGSPWADFASRAARRRVTPGGALLDAPLVRDMDTASAFARGTERMPDGRPLTGTFAPDYFDSEAFFEALRREGNTGVWTNPNDPSQFLLFDAHRVVGHGWRTADPGARAIFGPTVDFAGRFDGAVPRTLAERVIVNLGRHAARDMETHLSPGAGPALPVASAGSMIEPNAGTTTTDVSEPLALPTGEAVAPALPDTDLDPAALETSDAGVPMPEPPPSPVPFAPASLTAIAQQREDIAAAIEAVSGYVGEARDAEAHNRQAGEAATALTQRNATQAEVAGTERQTVAQEQGKLTQAEEAQTGMATENERASGEAARGESEASNVQSEGAQVSVEPRPEEPSQRSWLERAWDATAGALWDELVAPAVAAVREKVNDVMQSINSFITGMIDQALGLDEIEAELDGGGTDIADRSASLDETDAGLGESIELAGTEEERNRASAEQAEANAADAATSREDAQTLLADLRSHDAALAAEAEEGTAYVTDFGQQHAAYFEVQSMDDGMAGADTASDEAFLASLEPSPDESTDENEAA
ncbi:MAG: DUF4157 domain-containing protein [Hydrogenophaga sp.]